MNKKLSIDFEDLGIINETWNRLNYPEEGGSFIVSDGITSFVAFVPAGMKSCVITFLIPDEVKIKECEEKIKTDFEKIIKREFAVIIDNIFQKIDSIKSSELQSSISGSISEEALIKIIQSLSINKSDYHR